MNYPDLPAYQPTLDYHHYISRKNYLSYHTPVLPKLYTLNDHPGYYNFISGDASCDINYNISFYYNLSLCLLNHLSLT